MSDSLGGQVKINRLAGNKLVSQENRSSCRDRSATATRETCHLDFDHLETSAASPPDSISVCVHVLIYSNRPKITESGQLQHNGIWKCLEEIFNL